MRTRGECVSNENVSTLFYVYCSHAPSFRKRPLEQTGRQLDRPTVGGSLQRDFLVQLPCRRRRLRRTARRERQLPVFCCAADSVAAIDVANVVRRLPPRIKTQNENGTAPKGDPTIYAGNYDDVNR